MNALPLKPGQSPADIIEELIANHGLRAVVLALVTKLVKRTRPPDMVADPALRDQPEIDQLSDRMRADIGLPPKTPERAHIDLARAMQRDIFHL